MLFVPGSNAAWLSTVQVYGADYVMFDLEDSVSVREGTPRGCWCRAGIEEPGVGGGAGGGQVNAINTRSSRRPRGGRQRRYSRNLLGRLW